MKISAKKIEAAKLRKVHLCKFMIIDQICVQARRAAVRGIGPLFYDPVQNVRLKFLFLGTGFRR